VAAARGGRRGAGRTTAAAAARRGQLGAPRHPVARASSRGGIGGGLASALAVTGVAVRLCAQRRLLNPQVLLELARRLESGSGMAQDASAALGRYAAALSGGAAAAVAPMRALLGRMLAEPVGDGARERQLAEALVPMNRNKGADNAS
jgi:hypothetical protein